MKDNVTKIDKDDSASEINQCEIEENLKVLEERFNTNVLKYIKAEKKERSEEYEILCKSILDDYEKEAKTPGKKFYFISKEYEDLRRAEMRIDLLGAIIKQILKIDDEGERK